MTNQERMKAFELRLQGKNWTEIGAVLGYSRTAVQSDLRSCLVSRRKVPACVYPRLTEMIMRDYEGSLPAFAAACHVGYTTMYNCLNGRIDWHGLAPKICELTGLTPEEAFKEASDT